jgi:hypothetical protein
VAGAAARPTVDGRKSAQLTDCVRSVCKGF